MGLMKILKDWLEKPENLWCTGRMRTHHSKIVSVSELMEKLHELKKQGKRIVFTNGCFDILHPGHIESLLFARQQGDVLVVGLNSDESVRRNKGQTRPIVPQAERAKVLAAVEYVDFVVIFDEDEPADVIAKILPDVLVKGEDWRHYVSGREIVEQNGGKVVFAPIIQGYSTTSIVKRILAFYNKM